MSIDSVNDRFTLFTGGTIRHTPGFNLLRNQPVAVAVIESVGDAEPKRHVFPVLISQQYGTVDEHTAFFREKLAAAFAMSVVTGSPEGLPGLIPTLQSPDLTPVSEAMLRNGVNAFAVLPLLDPELAAASVGFTSTDLPAERVSLLFQLVSHYAFVARGVGPITRPRSDVVRQLANDLNKYADAIDQQG